MPNAYVLAMEDFDVDEETGFLPSQPPLSRLPPHYDAWEQALDNASALRMKLGERDDLTSNDRVDSAEWRRNIREVSPYAVGPQYQPSFIVYIVRCQL